MAEVATLSQVFYLYGSSDSIYHSKHTCSRLSRKLKLREEQRRWKNIQAGRCKGTCQQENRTYKAMEIGKWPDLGIYNFCTWLLQYYTNT